MTADLCISAERKILFQHLIRCPAPFELSKMRCSTANLDQKNPQHVTPQALSQLEEVYRIRARESEYEEGAIGMSRLYVIMSLAKLLPDGDTLMYFTPLQKENKKKKSTSQSCTGVGSQHLQQETDVPGCPISSDLKMRSHEIVPSPVPDRGLARPYATERANINPSGKDHNHRIAPQTFDSHMSRLMVKRPKIQPDSNGVGIDGEVDKRTDPSRLQTSTRKRSRSSKCNSSISKAETNVDIPQPDVILPTFLSPRDPYSEYFARSFGADYQGNNRALNTGQRAQCDEAINEYTVPRYSSNSKFSGSSSGLAGIQHLNAPQATSAYSSFGAFSAGADPDLLLTADETFSCDQGSYEESFNFMKSNL